MRRLRLSFVPALVIAAGAPVALLGSGAGEPAGEPAADLVEVFQIGRSGTGRAISVWRLGDTQPDQLGRGPDERPALLIVAGLDGRHDFGTRLALTLVDRLAVGHPGLLATHTVYIVPDLNPDNDAMFDRAGTPRAAFGRAPRQGVDADRDRRVDEDPADDVNGDGVITMMRVKDPAPGSGLRAEFVIDGDDPRLMRAPEKGEIATHAVLIEGIDNDGDGRFNEDGVAGSAGGGVDLDRNFPSLWPEFEDGAGPYALSEPETRSLVEWLMTRDNVLCTLTITTRDNIINTPAKGAHAPDGEEPTGIEEGDADVYEAVQKAFKEITGQTAAPKGDWEGSFTQWAYAHFGVYSFATPGWVRPDQLKADGEKQQESPRPEGGEPGKPEPGAERASLRARGVPEFIIEYLTADAAGAAALMAEFESLSQEEQASRMQAFASLPTDIQRRVQARMSGQPDPGAPPAVESTAPAAKGKKSESEDAKWLAHSDEHLGGAGFLHWMPARHPQLGAVEIGGFVPGLRHEPPESEWGRVADEQAAFIASLLTDMPDLRVETRAVERVGPGLWRVRVRATNPGEWPTRSAIGVKARRIPPIVLRLGVEIDRILSGDPVRRWDSIAGSGAFEEAEWLINAPDGSSVPVEIRSTVFGDRQMTIELKEGE